MRMSDERNDRSKTRDLVRMAEIAEEKKEKQNVEFLVFMKLRRS
jgi:hypothetical protein